MALGMLGTALAGGMVGLGESGKQLGEYVSKSQLLEEAAAIQKQRDATLAAIQERRDAAAAAARTADVRLGSELANTNAIAADERKRAPAIRAAAAARGLIGDMTREQNTPVPDELGGGPVQLPGTPISERRQLQIRADEAAKEGLSDDERGYRAQIRDIGRDETNERRLDLQEKRDEQRHQDTMKRLDQQFEHQKRTDSISASNAARLTAIAEEQIKGVKLDNGQKQQLADLDTEWKEATTDKARESIAQRRALLTGKWNESFEVKMGKDENGRDVVMGYIDKRRGTFTDNSGKVTDMRTGQSAGGASAAPSDAHIKALQDKRSDPRAVAAFDSQYGQGAAQRILGQERTTTPRREKEVSRGMIGSPMSAAQAKIEIKKVDEQMQNINTQMEANRANLSASSISGMTDAIKKLGDRRAMLQRTMDGE